MRNHQERFEKIRVEDRIAVKRLLGKAQSDIPILDLNLKRDNYLVANAAKLRRKLTTQELTLGYRQRELHNVNTGYYPNEMMLKEIKGWLRSIGW